MSARDPSGTTRTPGTGSPAGGNVPDETNRYKGRIYIPEAMTDLISQPDDGTPWRVEGFVADGTVTVLAAESSMGKSILLQVMCRGVVEGVDAAGFPCTKGTALYIDGEMGAKMFARRLRAASVAECRFAYVDALGLDISTTNPDDLGWVRSLIKEVGAKFVVMSSLRRLVPSKRDRGAHGPAEPRRGLLGALPREPDGAGGAGGRRSSIRRSSSSSRFRRGRSSWPRAGC